MASSRSVVIAMLFGGVYATQAEIPVGTDEDTELHWASLAELATRTSTSPRFADADEAQGEGVLEAFGAQYLPNAYAHYQEVRATAKEREQVLKENFPDGRSSDPAGGALYDKVRKATTKAVSEMFRRHDELCHYLLLHRMGAVSDRELTDLDATRISILLPDEYGPPPACNLTAPVLAAAEVDFASKYLPETLAAFNRFGNLFSEGVKAYGEWRVTALLVDASRSFPLFEALWNRLCFIQEAMNKTVQMVKEKKLLHAIGEATATTLAEEDKEVGLAVQQREKELAVGPFVSAWDREVAELVKQHSTVFIAKNLVENMVEIPGRSFLMGKYEVTQAQWEAVMGKNPSGFKGPDNPVENVSWDDCQEFLKKLNALPSVKKSGLVFRLPTEGEREYACRAGATGDYCKLANGTEITKSTLGRVAWFDDNSGGKTHPVGQKLPNAFGLYDMHGNVWEWTSTADGEDRRGGSWHDSARFCESSNRIRPFAAFATLGFRLCAEKANPVSIEATDSSSEDSTGSMSSNAESSDITISGTIDFKFLAQFAKATDKNELMADPAFASAFLNFVQVFKSLENITEKKTLLFRFGSQTKTIVVHSEEEVGAEIKTFIESLPDGDDKQSLLTMHQGTEE